MLLGEREGANGLLVGVRMFNNTLDLRGCELLKQHEYSYSSS